MKSQILVIKGKTIYNIRGWAKLHIGSRRIDVHILFPPKLVNYYYNPTHHNKEKDVELIAESMFNDIINSIKNYNIVMEELEAVK